MNYFLTKIAIRYVVLADNHDIIELLIYLFSLWGFPYSEVIPLQLIGLLTDNKTKIPFYSEKSFLFKQIFQSSEYLSLEDGLLGCVEQSLLFMKTEQLIYFKSFEYNEQIK